MTESLIKQVFIILGTLVVSLILFTIIFTASGQQFIWRAIEPAILNQWERSTFDNGVDRSLIFEEQFEEMKDIEYDRG